MFENSTTPADQGTPHFAAHWGIATLFSGPEAGMRAARASMRLISDGARRNSPGALIEFPHPGRVSL